MREIKFKGWCEKDSEWRYGFYITDGKVHEINTILKSGRFYASQVDVESVGQHTGLKDKNGVEIYEGDIVSDHVGVGEVKYSENKASFKVDYNDGFAKWFLDYTVRGERESIEVIGNIYESPELIEGEAND